MSYFTIDEGFYTATMPMPRQVEPFVGNVGGAIKPGGMGAIGPSTLGGPGGIGGVGGPGGPGGPDRQQVPISLTDPSNVFSLQDAVSDNLNTFQTKYARYMRCQNPNTVASPPCDVDGTDSLSSLNVAYQSLLTSIQDLSNSFVNQVTIGGTTPQENDKISKKIPIEYKQVLNLRSKLDDQLQSLYNQVNNVPDSPKTQLESAIYINTLWIILATCLLYYIFIGM